MKTSGCISIFRFTCDSPFSFCQWCRPPLYVAVQHSSILYVGSRIAWLYRLFHPLWFGTWRFSYLYDQTSSCTLISFLYVILGHWFRLIFPGHAQLIHYVLSVQLYLYTFLIYYILSIWCILDWAWVCPPQHELTLSFLSLVFGRLKFGEVLSCPCKVLSMCIIHFGHHVPLLTSYIRGHLL